MLRSLYNGATGMEAQQLKMDIISNNLANVSTTGFKGARAEFEDLLADTIRGPGNADSRGGSDPSALQVGLGVRTGAISHSFSQGDMIATSNPLDLAIQGTGFFRITLANGDTAYTRAGNFTTDSTGRVCTQHGELVDPLITVPQDSTGVTIKADGTVTAQEPGKTQPTELGTLELTMFTNPGGLQSAGNNLLTATAAAGDAQQVKPGEQGSGSLSQGFLESANVKAVEEMVDMISTQRAYELNSKVIQTVDQMLQRLTSIR